MKLCSQDLKMVKGLAIVLLPGVEQWLSNVKCIMGSVEEQTSLSFFSTDSDMLCMEPVTALYIRKVLIKYRTTCSHFLP